MAKPATVFGSSQPHSGASMMVNTSVVIAAIDSTIPPRSRRGAPASFDSGTSTTVATSATITTGTFTKKTEPHQKCSSSQPPLIGPAATAMPRDGAPDADRLGPLDRLGEHVGDDRERRREDERRADAHQRPAGDEALGRADGAGQRRRHAEHRQAGHEHPLAPVAVAEAAGREQQAGEHQQVGVDDPLQLAGGGVEVDGERRQGDVDDRAVEHRHEHGEADDGEDRPAAPVDGVVEGGAGGHGEGHRRAPWDLDSGKLAL